jgi:hypothetical protein
MVVVVDRPGAETRAEDVAPSLVAAVEPLRVDAVQMLHPGRQLLGRRLHDEVVVRAHHAECMQLPAKAADDDIDEGDEEAAVVVVEEDVHVEDALGRDVDDAVREEITRNARHASDRSSRRSCSRPTERS